MCSRAKTLEELGFIEKPIPACIDKTIYPYIEYYKEVLDKHTKGWNITIDKQMKCFTLIRIDKNNLYFPTSVDESTFKAISFKMYELGLWE